MTGKLKEILKVRKEKKKEPISLPENTNPVIWVK